MISKPSKIRREAHDLVIAVTDLVTLYETTHADSDLHNRGRNDFGDSDPTPASALDPAARNLRGSLRKAEKALQRALRELERGQRALRGAYGSGRWEPEWRQHDVLDGSVLPTPELEQLRKQRDERVTNVEARAARAREAAL